MTPVDFNTLAQQCAPEVHPTTLQAVVRTESGFNPFAIGVVGGRLVRQPQNRDEAVATVKALDAAGWNYSMGLSQVNRYNLSRFGMDANSAFDPCTNLHAGSAILSERLERGRFPSPSLLAQRGFTLAELNAWPEGIKIRAQEPHNTVTVTRVT